MNSLKRVVPHQFFTKVLIGLCIALLLASSMAGAGAYAAADVQAPTAPSNLQLTQASSNSLGVSWSASTDNVGVTGYLIYLNSNYVGNTSALTYTLNNLSAGTKYNVTVKAYDAAGNTSAPSAVLSATTTQQVASRISALGYSNIALKSDGTAWTWGNNFSGQLGNGNTQNSSSPVMVNGGSRVTAVAGGGTFAEGLRDDGSVWTWGTGNYGQLGNGANLSSYTPVQVSALSGVTAIASGTYHGIAVKSNGTVWTWGLNSYGQLGDGTLTNRSTPVQVSGLSSVVAVAGGESHSYALKSDGTVWAWGANALSQLGNGTSDSKTPVQVLGLSGVKAIASGTSYGLALKNDGTVWAWGYNGTFTTQSAAVQISGLSGVAAIAAGEQHALALKSDGTVWSFGANSSGQLGNGTTVGSNTPVMVSGLSEITEIASGATHSVALRGDGTVWAWGYNGHGQLGNGTTVNSSVPIQVSGLLLLPDTQAPTVPTGLSATNVADVQVSLSWNASSDNAGVNGYTIYNGNTAIGSSTSSTFIAKNLIPGTAYAFKVTAQDNAGNSSAGSNVVSVTTQPKDTAAPSAPTSLTVSDVRPTSVTLSWTAATDNIGVQQYTVYNGNAAVGSVAGTSFTVKGLALSTSYTFAVRAQDAAGNLSSPVTVTKTTLQNVTPKLAASDNISVGLDYEGNLAFWGINNFGQFGNGGYANSAGPVGVTGPGLMTAISSGPNHTVALRSDGTVWTWGYNGFGQLGNGTTASNSSPVQVTGLSPVTAVAAGSSHSVALKDDGTVWTWGDNSYGKLGNGTTTRSTVPVQVNGLSGIIAIAAAQSHTLALKNDGTVWAWGLNDAGQLGNTTTVDSWTPVQVTGLTGITSIAAGTNHSIALKNNGTVWTWGKNTTGQLGNGTVTGSNIPVQVSGLSSVTAISGGGNNTVALKTDGTVWATGYNNFGQIGNGTTVDRTTPVQVSGLSQVAAIASGTYHTLALRSDGTVWAWGRNNNGQLGNGTTVDSLTPFQVSWLMLQPDTQAPSAPGTPSAVNLADVQVTLTWAASTDNNNRGIKEYSIYNGSSLIGTLTGTSFTVKGLLPTTPYSFSVKAQDWAGNASPTSSALAVTTAAADTAAPSTPTGATVTASTTTSLTLSWTASTDNMVVQQYLIYNGSTLIGSTSNTSFTITSLNPGTAYTYTIQAQDAAGNLSSAASVNGSTLGIVNPKIAAGSNHTLLLKNDGTVWAWGLNSSGQLGNGNTTNSNVPVQINGLTGVVALSGGSGHTIALKSNGTVWDWGANNYGQLGTGTTTNSTTPIQVSGLTGVTAIAAGYLHNVALKSDGTVWTWGFNMFGQLGNGTTVSYSTIPVQVSGVTGAKAIAAGAYHTIIVKTDGSVWSVGRNLNGQLGNGSTADSNVPVQVSGLSGVNTVVGGNNHTLALKADGTVAAWGANDQGQLGNGTVSNSTTPVLVTGLTGVTAIAASNGSNYSVATKSTGTVWSWGANNYGQLGNGTTSQSVVPIQVGDITKVSAIAAGDSFTVMLKTDGTIWTWGYNGNGQLGNGTTTNANTPAQVQGVTYITNLSNSPTNLVAAQITDSTVSLLWTASQNAPVNSTYAIYQGDKKIGSTTDSTFKVYGLQSNTPYSFKVQLEDASGTVIGTPTSTLQITTLPVLNITNVKTAATSNQVTITWDPAVGAQSYEIEADGIIQDTGSNLYYVHSALSPTTQHKYRVRAKIAGNAGSWTDLISVTTLAQLPSTPPNLTLSAFSTTITATWGAVTGATRYELEVDGIIKNVGIALSYKQSELAPGTAHTYRVRSVNSAGAGNWSALQNVVTALTAPSFPSTLSATASNDTITIGWTDVDDAQGYEVKADGVVLDNGSDAMLSQSGLEPGTTHTYQVRAKNSVGTSGWSPVLTVTTYLLGTPSNVESEDKDTSFVLSWKAVTDATGYDVEIDGTSQDVGNVTSFEKVGLLPETNHTYRVRAKSSSGLSSWSELTNETTLPTRPTAPVRVTASVNKNTVVLSWEPVTGAAGYEVELDGSVVVDNFNSTQYSDIELKSYSLHQYRVRAKTDAIEGYWSAPIAAMTLAGDPTPPQNIVITAVGSIATLSWDAEDGATGYDVEVDGTVIDAGTKNQYKHRRIAVGTEHTYRVRARNSFGVSGWSGLIKNNAFTAILQKNKTLDLGLTAQDIVDFTPYTLIVTYDPKALEVTDLSTLTEAAELKPGAIEGTDITITGYTPGRIAFVANKVINEGESWTGVINSIQFKAKVGGGSSFTYTVYKKPEEVTPQ